MKAAAEQTLVRQLEMLRAVPRAPRRIEASALQAKLSAAGYEVSRRTIERDLHALSALFPLVLDDRSKPYGWSWSKDAKLDLLPGMSSSQAVALLLARAHLQRLLPRALRDELEGLFDVAERTVAASGWRDWHQRTGVVGMHLDLLPAEFAPDVLEAVQAAMAKKRCLRVSYRPKGNDTASEYIVHPLGVLMRGPSMYLVGTLFDYADVRQLAMHRIQSAEFTEERRREPKGFRFGDYIEAEGSSIGSEGAVRVLLRFDAAAAEHLRDTPLSADQGWREIEGGSRIEIAATVEDDLRLRWWLLGFGAQVEVVAPSGLRAEIGEELRAAGLRYGRPQES